MAHADVFRTPLHSELSTNSIDHALPTISRLPPELLAHVFALYVEDATARDAQSALRWVGITHVSRRWRQVALQDHSLWRRIPFRSGQRWADEFVIRSGPMPLEVSLEYDQAWNPVWPAHLLVKHFPRVERLLLRDKDPSLARSDVGLLDQPAPSLVSLSIQTIATTRFNLPLRPFDDHAPCLRHISIRRCPRFPWTSPVLRNLVSLRVALVATVHPPSSTEVLDAVRQMASLEELALLGDLPRFSRRMELPPPPIPTIELPRLRSLELQGYLHDCAGIIQPLRVPATATLHLSARWEGPAAEMRVLFPLLAAGGWFAAPCPFVTFWSSADDNFAVSARRAAATGAQGADLDVVLQLFWEDARSEWSSFDCMKAVTEALFVPKDLLDLQLFVHPAWTPDAWAALFHGAERMRAVGVDRYSGPALFRALAEHGGEEAPFLPRLCSMRISMVVLEMGRDGVLERTDAGRNLFACLKVRAEHGAPIETLSMFKCRVEGCVEDLKKIVPFVECL
ncbi:hypothetical protein BV25DRAFT_1995306 [Artomyces pyxidatus]|uniref:Uncharacterized protein n=1 Tax=Artomyces pyxidatus TaxID=48021 RepID=A0ACB8SKG2_9AGAM|nr:hypothetical protein BV25DRAFT_1995306 [Artomyces pyxidatus]